MFVEQTKYIMSALLCAVFIDNLCVYVFDANKLGSKTVWPEIGI